MIGPRTRGRGESENMSSSLSNGGGGEGEVCLDTGGVGSGMEGGGGGDEGGCITSECITSEEEGCKGGEAGGDVKVRDLWRVLQMKNFAPQWNRSYVLLKELLSSEWTFWFASLRKCTCNTRKHAETKHTETCSNTGSTLQQSATHWYVATCHSVVCCLGNCCIDREVVVVVFGCGRRESIYLSKSICKAGRIGWAKVEEKSTEKQHENIKTFEDTGSTMSPLHALLQSRIDTRNRRTLKKVVSQCQNLRSAAHHYHSLSFIWSSVFGRLYFEICWSLDPRDQGFASGKAHRFDSCTIRPTTK